MGPAFAADHLGAGEFAKSLGGGLGNDKLATAADWRTLDSENLLVMDIAAGRVIIELAPQFAPKLASLIVQIPTIAMILKVPV